MSDHIEPNLDAYLAGGLSPDERRDLEQHCAACSACAQQLTEGKQVDQLMNNLFAQTRPDAGLEDRTLERLRRKPAAKRYGILYFVYSAAAVIALGLIGAAAQAMIEGSRFSGVRLAHAIADERELNGILDNSEGLTRYNKELAGLSKIGAGVNERFSIHDGDPAAAKLNTDIQYMNGRLAKAATSEATPQGVEFAMPDLSNFTARVQGKRHEMAANIEEPTKALKAVDKFLTPSGSDAVTLPDDGKPSGGSWHLPGLNPNTIMDSDALRKFSDLDSSIAGKPGQSTGWGASATYYGLSGTTSGSAFSKPLPPAGNNPQMLAERIAGGAGAPPDPTVASTKKSELWMNEKRAGTNGLGDLGYYSFGLTAKVEEVAKHKAANDTFAREKKEGAGLEQKIAGGDFGKSTDGAKKGAAGPAEPEALDAQKQPEPMLDTGRKIIRTGEMEFEIDSFYASVDTINGLLKKVTKGAGFVATSNSDKLPNGKMKGSVVVRMPPQHLDDFLAELRAALGKVGELKSQRIGSADVTKQYTDIESELRAARAVETRLIEIIKTGKGEIKDLVAAERELGTWRTKIEKMEGEIRYYNNQVSLSTITITLTEKEIRAAVALVLRERVLMNIEVEEVEKAQESIAAGVKAAKGRILKNDLTVGEAGQISAVVHVEVPPESAPLFRELLKKLGVVSKYQADRTQQAVGGSAEKALDLKQRTDDVRFELNLYNSANIKPRETLHFKLGVADVTETYRTMRDAIAKMKGQIRKSDLNEKDPMNITAELVFNVAASDRAAIDKLIAAAGLIVSKHTVQAAINETATERTVGYELALRNIAAVPPRDIFTVAVASQDVAGSYRKLHDAVVQMKGRIHKGQLNEVDRFNVSAEFDFDAASADKPALDKLISEVGVTIARKNEQFPAKDESTDQKVGYRLTLRNASGMTPREKAMLAIRVNDVDGRAQQLKDLVAASKGRVMFSKSERSKNGETKMVLIFELPHAALDTIVRQIKEGQTPLVYDKELNPQVPDNSLATAQIALTLIGVPEILPSEGDGLGAMLHTGLSKAVYIFLWGVVVLISGLAIIVPWLIPIWIVVWLVRRRNAAKVVAVEAPPKVG